MTSLDPHGLADFQLRHDRAATGGDRWLFDHKLKRMAPSPLAFLRGAAPLFYEVLKLRPELAKGPGGEGWLTGDMHLENFGAYRAVAVGPADAPSKTGKTGKSGGQELAGEAVFDLNDFDDAIVGPFYFDVLRLTTSLILGGRELGANGVDVLELSKVLLESYGTALTARAAKRVVAAPVTRLLEQVENRPQRALLARRTLKKGEQRTITLKDRERYQPLSPKLAKEVPRAFAKYVDSLAKGERGEDLKRFEVLSVARRIAGTGSLGSLRIAVLTRGKGGRDGQWLFDLKEEGIPSLAVLLGAPSLDPAERVVAAARACLARPPRMLGSTHLRGIPLFGRRLAPQEDKLDLTRLDHVDLKPLASTLGQLLGRAHRRGATRLPKAPWSDAARARIVDNAITLAGIHEAVYLALCKEMRR